MEKLRWLVQATRVGGPRPWCVLITENHRAVGGRLHVWSAQLREPIMKTAQRLCR